MSDIEENNNNEPRIVKINLLVEKVYTNEQSTFLSLRDTNDKVASLYVMVPEIPKIKEGNTYDFILNLDSKNEPVMKFYDNSAEPVGSVSCLKILTE